VPIKSIGVPTKSIGVPTKSIGVPTKSIGVPTKSIGVPIKSIGEPIKSIGEPIKSIGEPTKSIGEPTKSIGEPNKSIGEPTKRLPSFLLLPTSAWICNPRLVCALQPKRNVARRSQMLIFNSAAFVMQHDGGHSLTSQQEHYHEFQIHCFQRAL